jgi:hypothetical protein
MKIKSFFTFTTIAISLLALALLTHFPHIRAASTPTGSLILNIATISGSANSGITLTGTAQTNSNGQTMRVWADACTTTGQCLRKEYTALDSATSATTQVWALNWAATELPAGTYSGTVWVGLAANNETLSTQSGIVNFVVAVVPTTFTLPVVSNQPFVIKLAPAANYQLGATTLPITQNDVTVSDNGGLTLSSPGLTTNTTVTLGPTSFVFTVLDPPPLQVLELDFE